MIRASEVVFLLTREDVIACAKEDGIPEEAITDDILSHVKESVQSAWGGWREVVKAAINFAMKN